MSAPLTISKDDLQLQEFYNYSAIDQYWADKGYTEDYLRSQYPIIYGCRSPKYFINQRLNLSFTRHYFNRLGSLYRHMEGAKKNQCAETSRRKINDSLGKILSRLQAWPGAGHHVRFFLPHHKRPRFHHTSRHSRPVVFGDHDLHLCWKQISLLRNLLSARRHHHYLR